MPSISQPQLSFFYFNLINSLIEWKAYIKPYGTNFRIVNEEHSPKMNLTKDQLEVLVDNKIVKKSGLIWNVVATKNPFKNFTEIITTKKQTK